MRDLFHKERVVRLRQELRQGAKLLDWLLQKPCPLCDRLTPSDLCRDCWKQVERCQLSRSAHLSSGSGRSINSPGDLPVLAWGTYEGALKRTIAVLKYQNQPQLARPLGDRLAQAWMSASPNSKPLAVVPIPLHAEKQQQRGFNQAERLAEAFCDRTGFSLQREGLIRVRSTEAQFRLDAAARQQNLSNAFQIGRFTRSAPSKILLLDDIYTTGATARAAVQALHQQPGVEVLGIAVIARTHMNSG
jgi:ComF family protein